MKLILVRHARTIGNEEERLAGITDSPYTEVGYEQANNIIDYLATQDIDKILTSPLSRCEYIAKGVAEKKQMPYEIKDDLIEMNFGDFENLQLNEIKKNHPKDYKLMFDSHFDYTFKNGQSWLSFHQSKESILQKLRQEDGTILICSHAGTIRSFIVHLLGISIDNFYSLFIGNTAVVEIECDEKRAVITALKNIDSFEFWD